MKTKIKVLFFGILGCIIVYCSLIYQNKNRTKYFPYPLFIEFYIRSGDQESFQIHLDSSKIYLRHQITLSHIEEYFFSPTLLQERIFFEKIKEIGNKKWKREYTLDFEVSDVVFWKVAIIFYGDRPDADIISYGMGEFPENFRELLTALDNLMETDILSTNCYIPNYHNDLSSENETDEENEGFNIWDSIEYH